MRKFASSAIAVLVLCGVVSGQQTLTTTFASNNGQSGNMFDLVAVNCTGVVIDSFDVNIDAFNPDETIEVYTVTGGGSFLGLQNTPAAWTLLATTTVVSAGTNVPTPLALALNVSIPAGATRGFYVTCTTSTNMNYTNGSTPGAIFAQDANLQFLEGSGHSYPFGSNFTPRVFNGNIHYTVAAGSPPPFTTGNLAGPELQFKTGTSGLTPDDKVIPLPNTLTMSIESCDQSLVGAPFITVASLVATGSDPTNDLGSELGIVGLSFVDPLIVLINGFAPTGLGPNGGAAISPAGSVFAIALPCGFPVGLSAYIQSACPDASKPNGLTLSQSIEHELQVSGITAGPTGDDASTNISFGCFGTFDYYGVTYGDLWVNSNGSITFGSGDSDWTSSEAEFLADQPRVAPFWNDLSPNVAGSISVAFSPTALAVTYTDVPNFGAAAGTNEHSGTVVFNASGNIDIIWNELDSNGNSTLAGISPGNALSLPGGVDFVGATGVVGGSNEALYQNFDGSCGNEANRIAGAAAVFSPVGDAYVYAGIAAVAPNAIANAATPSSGSDLGNEPVQIDGAFFDTGATYTVEFGAGNSATAVVVVDACTITCVTPAGSGTVDVIVTDTGTTAASTITGGFTYIPSGVTLVTVTDDGFANVVLSAPFTYYGVAYNDLFVNANGSVSFVAGIGDFSPTSMEMLDQSPRIAGIWSDLAGSTVTVTDLGASIDVAFAANHHNGSGPNAFSIGMDRTTGNIGLTFGVNDSFNGVAGTNVALAGISSGGVLGVALGVNTVVDLNGAATLAVGANDALFETFNGLGGGGPWDLDSVVVPFTATGGVGVGPYQAN